MTELMKRGTGEAVVTELVMEEKVRFERLLDVVWSVLPFLRCRLFCESRITGTPSQVTSLCLSMMKNHKLNGNMRIYFQPWLGNLVLRAGVGFSSPSVLFQMRPGRVTNSQPTSH